MRESTKFYKYKWYLPGVWKEKPNTVLDYTVEIGQLPDNDKKSIQLGGMLVYDLAGEYKRFMNGNHINDRYNIYLKIR